MRTQDEIIQKIKESNSFFGFEREVLLRYVDFVHAKEFLKPEYVEKPGAEEEWNKSQTPLKDNQVRADLAEYMYEYGWDKAENHRGLSANRTIEKMEAWLWLLGDDETLKAVQEAEYTNYGCPKLAVICRKYDLKIPDSPEVQNMIKGEKCTPDCRSCGT